MTRDEIVHESISLHCMKLESDSLLLSCLFIIKEMTHRHTSVRSAYSHCIVPATPN